jgi:hypothetical protein
LPKGKDPYHPEYPDKKIDLSDAERIPLENGETILIKTDNMWHETWLIDKNGKMLAQCGFHNTPDKNLWPVMTAYSSGNRKAEILLKTLCLKKSIVITINEMSPGGEKLVKRLITSSSDIVAWCFDQKKQPLFKLKNNADLKRLYAMGNNYYPMICVGTQSAIDNFFGFKPSTS